jgi:hypothetical protein
MGDVVPLEGEGGELAVLRRIVAQFHARCRRTWPSLKHQGGWSGGVGPPATLVGSANVTRIGIEITVTPSPVRYPSERTYQRIG